MPIRKLFFSPDQNTWCSQLMRFSFVGALGYCCDVFFVLILRPYVGLVIATILSYFDVASLNWCLNDLWSFRRATPRHQALTRWLRYLGTNSLGFFLNRGSVILLCSLSTFSSHHVALSLSVGALVGLGANFSLSRKLVFTSDRP